jgi:hypothetical protein
MLGMDSGNLVERNMDVDEKIVFTLVQKEVTMSNLHHMEEKAMTKLFHIKIQVKIIKVDALFDSDSHANLGL